MKTISGTPSRGSLVRANAPAPWCARDRVEIQPVTRNKGPSAKAEMIPAGKATVDQSFDVVRSMLYQSEPSR